VMMAHNVGIGHNVAVDDLVIENSRRMTVGVHMAVSVHVTDMRRCSRHEMTTAQCAIDHEGKRRHHRQGGQDASAHR
jgi:hypothetical protein